VLTTLWMRGRQKGFTLVELMIGLVIVGVLMMQAIPSFSAWIQNMKVRNGAEAILNGLQLARSQAVRSNASTELALITGEPLVTNVGAAASTTGTNWIVRNFQAGGVYTATDFVQGRSGKDGAKNAVVAAGQGSFVFTPLGRLLNPPVADVAIDVSIPTGTRPMRIVVSPGGQFLMCDPNATAKAANPNNPQFCP
jgi:type IV fimbrial biogenesis protein FimT